MPGPNFGQGAVKNIAQNDRIVIRSGKGRNAARQNVAVGGNIHEGFGPIAPFPRYGVATICLHTFRRTAETGSIELNT